MELVITDREDGTSLFCGGTWVGDRTILTAGHCAVYARDNDDTSLEFGYVVHGDATPRPFKVTKLSEGYDLALLEASDPPEHPSAKLSGVSLAIGADVVSSNHTGREEYSFMRGYVEAIRFDSDGKTYQVAMATAYKGASGAGIFDMNYHLQGVFSYAKRAAPGSIYCVHRDIIAGFM